MLRSSRCVLHGRSEAELARLGEFLVLSKSGVFRAVVSVLASCTLRTWALGSFHLGRATCFGHYLMARPARAVGCMGLSACKRTPPAASASCTAELHLAQDPAVLHCGGCLPSL